MILNIHGHDLYTEGLENVGYKLVVLSVIPTDTYEEMQGTYLKFDLVRPSDTAILQGVSCGSGNTCQTDLSNFSGDPTQSSYTDGNRLFTYTNMATIEKVPGESDSNNSNLLTISVIGSSSDVSVDYGTSLCPDGDLVPGPDPTICDHPNGFVNMGAIWVLGFPDPL